MTNPESDTTMKRYLLRGQLHEAYALNPNPRKVGRSHGYFASLGGLLPNCVRSNAKTSYGWELEAISPSMSLVRRLLGVNNAS